MSTDEKILDRVQKLLNIAEHPGTGEHEADVALRQAQSLITKHAIDEALLRMSQTTEQRRAPEKRTIKLAEGGSGSYISRLRTILQKIAETNRCSVAITYYNADVYGASEDVSWVEMLYTSVYFQLLSKINPRWDDDKSYDENVYTFKIAGYKWRDINMEAIKHDRSFDARVWEESYFYTTPNFHSEDGLPRTISAHWQQQIDAGLVKVVSQDEESGRVNILIPTDKIKGSMIGAYRRHAKLIGDKNPVSTQSHSVYRLSFVDGFTETLLYRLDVMWKESQESMDTIPGAALALQDFGAEVKKMFYGDHPEMDPEQARLRREKEKQERAEMLDAMTPKQRYEFLEKEERAARRLLKRVRYYTPDDSGSSRGQRVANSIDLTRKAGAAGAGESHKALR